MVQALHLFSTNEEYQDITTTDLRYIICPNLVANLILKTNAKGKDRIALLDESDIYLSSFIDLCECYGFPFEFPSEAPVGLSQEAARQRKIDSFRHKKKLEASLLDLQKDGEESETRELAFIGIELSLIDAFEQKRHLSDEKEMILYSLSNAPKSNEISQLEKVDFRMNQMNLGASGSLLDSKGRPNMPFVITSKRHQVQESVFRPGHNLPTMSIEDYLDREMARGNFLSSKDNEPPKEIDEDRQTDQQVYELRATDEFKDLNPRGWGNRKNKG